LAKAFFLARESLSGGSWHCCYIDPSATPWFFLISICGPLLSFFSLFPSSSSISFHQFPFCVFFQWQNGAEQVGETLQETRWAFCISFSLNSTLKETFLIINIILKNLIIWWKNKLKMFVQEANFLWCSLFCCDWCWSLSWKFRKSVHTYE